jgi:2-polyprenyl-3-methyl-5-hydroxy-6-metoxy-1,4-benzoquinol methylase
MVDTKQDWYYGFVRKDIAPVVPEYAENVLEVGCGAGATLQWLKECGRAGRISGIELNHEAAELAFTRLDKVYAGDANMHMKNLRPESHDLVLCLDVLEHLKDPWQTLKQIFELVRPGGHVVVSLPNVRHRSVLMPLLFKGQWQYTEAGIMDRTHLRFFTRQSALEMLQQAGFSVSKVHSNYSWRNNWDKWKDILSFGLFNEFLTFQYIIRAEKPLKSHSESLIQGFFPHKTKAAAA